MGNINLTNELKGLLNPNTNTNNKNVFDNEHKKEDKKMANLKDKVNARKKQEEAEANATVNENVETASTETTETPEETATNENGAVDTAQSELDELNALAKGAMADSANASTVNSGDIQKTGNFVGGNTGLDVTPNASEKSSRPKKTVEESNQEAAKHNQEVLAWMSSITKKSQSVGEISEKQKTLQAACAEHFRAGGFIVLQDAFPELKVTRTYLKDDNKMPLLKAGKTQADYDTWLKKPTKTREKKGKLVQSEAKFTLSYSTPKKILGAIISMPLAANITVEEFQNENFEINFNEMISGERLNICVDFETFFVYNALFCGGVMREADYMNDNVRFEKKPGEQKIKAAYQRQKSTTNGIETYTTKKVLKPLYRKSLLVRENIIPINRYKTISLSKLTGSSLEAYKTKIKNALGKPKDEDDTIYSLLKAKHKDAVSVTFDTDDHISNIELSFINGYFGSAGYEDVKLLDWSNVTKNQAGGVEKQVYGDPKVVDLAHTINKEGKQSKNPSKITLTLERDFTLDTLATEGYKAAAYAKELGITAKNIYKVYEDYTTAEQARKSEEAYARDVNGKQRVARRSNELPTTDAARLILADLTAKEEISDANINSNVVASSIRSINIRYGNNASKATAPAEA